MTFQPINVIEREWHTIEGHPELGEFPFEGNPAYAKADELCFGDSMKRPPVHYHHVNRKTSEVIRSLNAELKRSCPEFANIEYGFTTDSYRAPLLWPDSRWLAIYVVTGGSEGHYIHIDAIYKDGKVQQVSLAKLLSGQDDAFAVSNMATRLLGA